MSDLEKLLVVAQARYDQQRQVFVKIVQEENSLRAELDRISGLDQRSDEPENPLREMQAIGADLLWRAWLGRSRTTLNQELARILARKGHEQGRVRRAFGKVAALQDLIDENKTARRKYRAQLSLGEAVTQAVSFGPKNQ